MNILQDLDYEHINHFLCVCEIDTWVSIYCKVSNIRRTKSQNLNSSRLIL